MMMIKRLSWILLFAVLSPAAEARDDFKAWFESSVEKRLFKKLDLKLAGAVRTYENSSKIEQYFLEPSVQYRISKNISIEGIYRLIKRIEDDDRFHYRHRFAFDLNASLPVGDLSFFSRLRIQRSAKTYIEDDEDLISVYAARLKLGTEYRLRSLPLKPYLFAESYTAIYPESNNLVGRYRLSAGTVLRITRKLNLDTGYIFQRDPGPGVEKMHIISLELNYRF